MALPIPLRLSALSMCALIAVAASAVGAQTPIGLQVFGDNDFKGVSAAFVRDNPDLGAAGLARVVSSLRVADGEVWEVCTEPNYRGRCRTVSEDIDDLRRGGWNDVIASVRRVRGGSSGRSFGPGFGRPGATGLHLFSDVNYKGSTATLTSNTTDLDEQGMARAVSSVRVDPDEAWQVCSDTNFRGRCTIISEDQSDLRRGGWNDVIMSARRVRAPGSSFGGNRGAGLQVFADINYRGRTADLSSNTPDLRGMARTVSSLRVAPGEVWEVCSETNYRGRCQIVSDDESDLRKGDWNDVIASARRVR